MAKGNYDEYMSDANCSDPGVESTLAAGLRATFNAQDRAKAERDGEIQAMPPWPEIQRDWEWKNKVDKHWSFRPGNTQTFDRGDGVCETDYED